jgi:ferritin-like metal-binding protein YciE
LTAAKYQVLEQLVRHWVSSSTLAKEEPMTAADNTLYDWLHDAHAMEQQALTMLKAQQSRLENYPEVRKRITEHIAETERQAELIRGSLKTRGFVSDEAIKSALVSYAFEHFEVASYRMLEVVRRIWTVR